MINAWWLLPVIWLAVCVGFVLGAAWNGLCRKNDTIEECIIGQER